MRTDIKNGVTYNMYLDQDDVKSFDKFFPNMLRLFVRRVIKLCIHNPQLFYELYFEREV